MNPGNTVPAPPPPEEELRTFREFFPDPEVRKALHYGFAHRELVRSVFANPVSFFRSILGEMPGDGPRDDTRWIQARWVGFVMMLHLRSRIDFGWVKQRGTFARMTDLSMEVRNLDGVPLALVRMPRPEFFPCAHYMGIVGPSSVDSDQGTDTPKAWYFTLEQMSPELPQAGTHGVFCEWTADGTHRTFNPFEPLDGGDAFCARIRHHLEHPDLVPAATSRR